jgi:phage portal protein BeeE
MTVNSYLFQSPYSQSVQVGRPDPVMIKERTEETQQQNEKVEKNDRQLSQSQSQYNRSETALKSSVGYAQSEGFAMSSEGVQKLSDASLSAKRGDLPKIYSQNAEE